VVVNVPEVTASVGEAVEKCEKMAGTPLLRAYVGIAGSHIGTFNSSGISPVDKRQGVTSADMHRALEGASAVALPHNTEIIHTIARQWTVDGQGEVQEPLGMNGYRLEVDAHIVTGSSTAVNNLVQCITAHEIEIDELVLEPLASNEAVLKPEERRMGVAIVDIGGGTTDIAVFLENHLCHTQILDMGGNHLTNDIAVGLHAPFETAEELKLRYGHVLPERVAEDERVWAAVFGEKTERSFSRRFVCEVLQARATEVLEIVRTKLEESGQLDRLPAGIVLTGGSSQLAGLAELGRTIFNLPVRVGSPNSTLPIHGLSRNLQQPLYATSVGLLLWGLGEDDHALHRRFEVERVPVRNEWMGKTMNWLKHLLPG
jgi:cell division protein FtsA